MLGSPRVVVGCGGPPKLAKLGSKRSTIGAGAARNHLAQTLDRAITYQRRLVLVPLGLAIALFVAGIVLVARHASEPDVVKAIFAACGVSLTAPFAWATAPLRQLWRCEIIAVAMPLMTNEELSKLVTATLDKFGGDSRASNHDEPAARRAPNRH